MRLNFPDNSYIAADLIRLGKDFKIGKNVHIKVRGQFKIGDFGRFGDNVDINAETIEIGKHFFHYEPGLRVGGGGSQFRYAKLTIGDRCVVHNNYINLAREVTLGHDVGLSPDVDIITHGFWQSPLEGYPIKYGSVSIGNGTIVGQGSMILAGAEIMDNVIIGAGSVVRGRLMARHVYAGNPVRMIREIIEPRQDQKEKIMAEIIKEYRELTCHPIFGYDYPYIYENDVTINVETRELKGEEDEETDQLRDFLRRHGIRIYTERPFISL